MHQSPVMQLTGRAVVVTEVVNEVVGEAVSEALSEAGGLDNYVIP